jgi:peptidoglycan/LPS O-acetylase OafA/YrhL
MVAWRETLWRVATRIYGVPDAGGRMEPLEGLRAYAAFLIFLVHYADSYAGRVLGVDLNALRLTAVPDVHTGLIYYLFASHYGVDVFFFLSGLLICRIVARPSFGYGHFILHRLARIYPAALIALVVWAYVRIAVQGRYPLDIRQFLGNLLFLNAIPQLEIRPYNTVTWSLFFEFAFYLSFPLVLWFGGRRRVTPWRIVLFALLVLPPVVLAEDAFFIRFLMFFGGAFMGVLPQATLRRLAARVPDTAAIAFYVSSTILFAQLLGYAYFIPVFAVTTFTVILKMLHGDGVLRRVFSWTPLRYLGNVSYSFFLVHGLAIELVMSGYGRASGNAGAWSLAGTFAAALFLSTVLATALFIVAEKPYFTWRQSATERLSKPPEPAVAVSS